MQLASRFASRSPSLRSDSPLSDDQIRRVAPSIFADAPHESRSERYSYIPTAAVLTELRKEGFQPFMVAQTRVRNEDRRDFTKHMIRLRHANQINDAEANEIVLLNSHDGGKRRTGGHTLHSLGLASPHGPATLHRTATPTRARTRPARAERTPDRRAPARARCSPRLPHPRCRDPVLSHRPRAARRRRVRLLSVGRLALGARWVVR